MNLDDIMNKWESDCQIVPTAITSHSTQTPKLHAEYLRLLGQAKLKLKMQQMKQKTLLRDKWLWYNGKMTQQQLDDLGWDYDPLNGLKVLKGDMNHFYDSDPEIQASEQKIEYYKTMVNTLESIVDALKWRHQTIKNIIEWEKFQAGG